MSVLSIFPSILDSVSLDYEVARNKSSQHSVITMIKAKNIFFPRGTSATAIPQKKWVIFPLMYMLNSLLQDQTMSSGKENYTLLSPYHKKITKQLLELKCNFKYSITI